jgi:hypothetical protein
MGFRAAVPILALCLALSLSLYIYIYRERERELSVEMPSKCSFVMQCIIPKFFKGSTCFERHTANHQEL